jgi:hypothetical protein
MNSEMSDFLDWMHEKGDLAFTYRCQVPDFVSSSIQAITLIDVKSKDKIEIHLPLKKKENEQFLRTVRKSLLELTPRTVICHGLKDFLNFIPGEFNCTAQVFDLQLLRALKSTPKGNDKVTPENILAEFKKTVSGLSMAQEKLYFELLLPSIFFYSKLEKQGLPTASGRLFSYYNLDGTVSGRLTNSSFDSKKFINPLNLAKEARKVVQAPLGYTFIHADYNAMEIRVLGYISQDQGLLDVFHSNQDIYAWIGKKIFGIADVSPEQRKFIKDLCFHIVYGGSEFGFSKQQGCTVVEAKGIIEKFFSLFPTLEEWILNTQIGIIEKGFVESLLGRVRELDFTNQGTAIRQGQNFLVQSLANDVMTSVILELDQELLPGSRILIHQFDSILVQSPSEQVGGNTHILNRVMKNPAKIRSFGVDSLCLDPVLDFSDCWR